MTQDAAAAAALQHSRVASSATASPARTEHSEKSIKELSVYADVFADVHPCASFCFCSQHFELLLNVFNFFYRQNCD